MEDFDVSVGTLPDSISEFHSAGSHRMGDPALVIRHISGPWSTTMYTSIASLINDPNVRVLGTHAVGKLGITVGVTTSKGSTDGVPWERPSLAYASDGGLDDLGVEDGSPNTYARSVFYLFPKHRSDN